MTLFRRGLFVAFPLVLAASSRLVGEEPWKLDVEMSRPQQLILDVALEGEQGYWYMTYEVTNRTGKEQYLLLKISLTVNQDATRTFRDRLIPALEQAIEKNMDTPLCNRIELIGPIREGETRKCIALFGPIGTNIRSVEVTFDGLAEERLIRRPNGQYLFRTRQACAVFERIGDPATNPYPTLRKKNVLYPFVDKPVP